MGKMAFKIVLMKQQLEVMEWDNIMNFFVKKMAFVMIDLFPVTKFSPWTENEELSILFKQISKSN